MKDSHCINCNKSLKENSFKTVYGDQLCEDCWDDYLCTEAGMLEYLIGICFGSLSAQDFDADFLGGITKSYKINSKKLNLTAEQLAELEQKATVFGIL